MIDTQIRHSNTGPHFNRRVAEGRIGVALLRRQFPQITHLRDVQHIPWGELADLLPEEITADELRSLGIDPDRILDEGRSADTTVYNVRARCRHVHSENQRVLETVEALQAGDMQTVGKLLLEAHQSAARDYQISTTEVDLLVQDCIQAGAVGARLTGAGWGGCVVALVATDRVGTFVPQVLAAFARQTGLRPEAFVCRSARGAGLVLNTTL